MSQAVTAAVMILGSGALHAVVNAIFKSGGDKMSSRALIDGFSGLLVVPLAFVVPLPTGAWSFIFASWATHVVYLVCLIRSFEQADMSFAYPIARGVAPALAATIAVGVYHERVTLWIALGIGLVSAGVIAVGGARSGDRRSLGWALATGVTIACYTVIDAGGVRRAPSALSYITWTFIMLGFGISALFALWRGRRFLAEARTQWRPGLFAGALSIACYGLALGAYRLGATPQLAALRETSILFGVLIAIFFLKERVTRTRLLGISTIAVGATTLMATSLR